MLVDFVMYLLVTNAAASKPSSFRQEPRNHRAYSWQDNHAPCEWRYLDLRWSGQSMAIWCRKSLNQELVREKRFCLTFSGWHTHTHTKRFIPSQMSLLLQRATWQISTTTTGASIASTHSWNGFFVYIDAILKERLLWSWSMQVRHPLRDQCQFLTCQNKLIEWNITRIEPRSLLHGCWRQRCPRCCFRAPNKSAK